MALTKHKGLHALLFSVVAISIFAEIQLHSAAKTKAVPRTSTATQAPAETQSTTTETTSTSARDTIYFNGYVYTVDDRDSVKEALVVRDGRIAYVGSNADAKAMADPTTHVVDLHGRMLMPGLVDGHMHPQEGGVQLLKCNLNYERLTVAQFQSHIQDCLDKTRDREPDQWLEVVNWFQQDMIPAGTEFTHETLDALKTRRPIAVMSSFGHSVLANERALKLGHVEAGTRDPIGGKIQHKATGQPSGILEDAAYNMVMKLIPPPTAEENVAAARAALDALRKQGITTFLDADAENVDIESFT